MIAIDLDAPVNTRQFVVGASLIVAAFTLMIAAVFATGSTFGQRCAESNTEGSAAWNKCVKEMAGGGSYR